MRVTIPYLTAAFNRFNKEIFKGKLEQPCIVLSTARSFLGAYSCKHTTGNRLLGHVVHVLKFSTSFDLPEDEWEDIVIHEMIHFYISVGKMHDDAPHGTLFRGLMAKINQTYGRHICIRHKSNKDNGQSEVHFKKKYRTVAVVRYTDGRVGIKVLPRVGESILYYYRNAMKSSIVDGIHLFLTHSDAFASFPSSKSLKVYIYDKDKLREDLKGAWQVVIENGWPKLTDLMFDADMI